MCGIAGILRNRAVNRSEIQQLTSTLAHRGPDGEGIWLEGNIALGHRRLSIIDLGFGKQPMSNEDGTVWITYNGEIYNFLELKKQLTEKGHKFRTHSDTEVIIHAYEEWSENCVNYFRGMFAFGIVDKKNRKIFLARDHFGIKPLVYYTDASCFSFASEIQALIKLEDTKLELDMQAIDQYLWFQYIPAPRTVYKQMKKLPPAHRMSVTFDGLITGPEEYWKIEFRPDNNKTKDDWIEGLDEVLCDSVKSHLISDVPFGAFLSGGVDSSAVVAYMSQILDKPVKTFSIGFEEEDYNELKYAEIVAKRWGTEHYSEIVKPDALEILPKLVKHYGEPFGDSSSVPMYYVSKLARQKVTLVLSGDGGDETFAGYNSYLDWMKYLNEIPENNRAWWKQALYPLASKLMSDRYPPFLKHGSGLKNWLTFINYIHEGLRSKLWRSEYKHIVKSPFEEFEKEFNRTSAFSNANKVQYMDLKSYLPFDILTKVDIAGMMNSLEVRTPIVDKKVIEFGAKIPETFNIRKDSAGKWEGKLLLKDLMARYYPSKFLNRNKMGFTVPIKKWFSSEGILHREIRERLLGSSSTLKEYFRPNAIKHLMDQNQAGRVWLLLFLDEWLRQNKEI